MSSVTTVVGSTPSPAPSSPLEASNNKKKALSLTPYPAEQINLRDLPPRVEATAHKVDTAVHKSPQTSQPKHLFIPLKGASKRIPIPPPKKALAKAAPTPQSSPDFLPITYAKLDPDTLDQFLLFNLEV